MISARVFLSLVILCLPMKVRADLAEHADLLVADPVRKNLAEREVRITYLGTNGYLLEARNAAILIDPYATRISLWAAMRNARITSDPIRLRQLRGALPKRLDAILVTHGHFDHLLDAVPLAREFGAPLIASKSSTLLAEAAGALRCRAVKPGDVVRHREARIHVMAAAHDRLFGLVPFPGSRHVRGRPPKRVADWVCGEPLAFLIELGGQRIYIDSGGACEPLPRKGERVDLAILGTALPDSRRRYSRAVNRLNPRYVLPSHQDDFFRPMDRGFVFGMFTDFRKVRREHAVKKLPGRLILLDYFRAWTLR